MERNLRRIARRVVIPSVLAALSLSVVSESVGKSPTPPPDYSNINFKPVAIDNGPNKDPVPIRKDRQIDIFIASSPPTLPEPTFEPTPQSTLQPAEQTEKPLSNLEIARQKIIDHPEIFSQKWLEDFDIYGKIYMGVSEKYPEVDWFLLQIVHEAETGASDSVIAFNGGTAPYYGGMQRNPAYWTESYVDDAFQGLEYLAQLPQRHSDDSREIAGAAKELRDNIVQYARLGKEKAVLNALSLYSAKWTALLRDNQWLIQRGIFNPNS